MNMHQKKIIKLASGLWGVFAKGRVTLLMYKQFQQYTKVYQNIPNLTKKYIHEYT